MRRLFLAPLFVSTLLVCLLSNIDAQSSESPFKGTWKVTMLGGTNEQTLWLVEIDKDGKTIKLVDGLAADNIDVRKTKFTEIKSDAKALRCTLLLPQGGLFGLVVYPPAGKEVNKMTGSLRQNLVNFVRLRFERTKDTEIEPAKAQRNLTGAGDIEAAGKLKDAADRISALRDIIKRDHADKPITYLASHFLLTELIGTKAKAEDFQLPAGVYLKQSEMYGHEITVGAYLFLGQLLSGYEPTAGMGLAFLQKGSEMLTDDDPKGLALSVHLTHIEALENAKKKAEVKPIIERLTKAADATVKTATDEQSKFGLTELVVNMTLASPNEAVQELALSYADSLAKLLKDTDPAGKKMVTYQYMAAALDRRGKKDEAKKWAIKIEGLEQDLDKEFEKANVPFEVTKYDGRKSKSKRVVLVELFTGAHARPTVAADVAFDAALRTYKSSEVVFLRYHLHAPSADPLANADTEARANYYRDELVEVPSMFIDGRRVAELGGSRPHAEKRYERLRELLDKAVEKEQQATINLKVERSGDTIDMSAKVSGVQGKAVLHFAVVEDVVRYVGVSGQRLHQQVVRAMPAGVKGIVVGKEGTHKTTFELAGFRVAQNKYLDEVPKRPDPKQTRQWQFPSPARPMEMKRLKVIAFVQGEDRRIQQAAQAEVPLAK